MKNLIRQAAAVLFTGSVLSALAAEPSAVWSRNFLTSAPSAGSTLELNGNTAPDNGDVIVITKGAPNYEGGARVIVADDSATAAAATIIFKVADLPRNTEAFLISMHNKLSAGVGVNDPRGVYVGTDNKIYPIVGGNKVSNATAGSELADHTGVRTFAFVWTQTKMELFEVEEGVANSKYSYSYGNQGHTFGGCTIGAAKAKSSGDKIKCATGLKILGAAVFNGSALTADEIAAYAFPYGREGVIYDYVFLGTESGVWETLANWKRPQDKIPYALSNAAYAPAAFDGEVMQNGPVTATDLEGWQFKVALYNGAKVTVGAINKLQDNTSAEDGNSIRVDATSKLYIGGWGARAGTMQGTTKIQVDAPDGLEFGAGTKSGSYTFNYFLRGEGSVKFGGAVDHGTHAIKSVEIALGEIVEGGVKVLRRKQLISYASAGVNFNTSGAVVTNTAGTSVEPKVSVLPLTSDSAVGDYRFEKTATGLYLNYVDMVPPRTPVALDLAFTLTASGNTMTVTPKATMIDGTTETWDAVPWTATTKNSARGNDTCYGGMNTGSFLAHFSNGVAAKDGVIHPSINVKMTDETGSKTNGGTPTGKEWWSMVLDVAIPDGVEPMGVESIQPQLFICNASGAAQTAYQEYKLIDCDLAIIDGETTTATTVLTSQMGNQLRNTEAATIAANPGRSFKLFIKAQAHTDNNGFFSGIDGVTLTQTFERLSDAFEATINGETAWGDIVWTKTSDGSPATLPENLSMAVLAIHGKGLVTGLASSPLGLALDEFVACDVTAATATSFSGAGRFLVKASSLTSATTLDSSVRRGVIGYGEAGETATGALTINSNPFYSYGNATLNNASFSGGGEVFIESGNLTLKSSGVQNRYFKFAPGATLTIDADLTLNSNNSSGYYGNGTFAVAPNRTVHGGYLGVDAKFQYSGEGQLRQQIVWTDHGKVGADATLKFTTMSTTLDTNLTDFLGRFEIEDGGRIELYAHGSSAPYLTLPETDVAATCDPTGGVTMGYAAAFGDLVKLTNIGYDTSFTSALTGADGFTAAESLPAGTFTASLYADVSGALGETVLTLGDPSVAALRLLAKPGMMALAEVKGGTVRELGLLAPRVKGYHLYTVVRSGSETALYFDGTLQGIDFSVTDAVSGAYTLGGGLAVRMVRVEGAKLGAAAVQTLAASWPVIDTTTPRVSSEWAAKYLPPDVVEPIYKQDYIPTKDEIDAFMAALEAQAANKKTFLQSYLLGLDPEDPVPGHTRAYINEVKFSADPIDFAQTNATVLLEYANPAANSGINVTYRLQARGDKNALKRDIPVVDGQAVIRDLEAGGRTATAYKAVTEVAPKKPNVIFVLADDLGYGDVGWMVQNKRKAEGKDCWIETPHMDQMAAEGCTMTAHYAACPVCAPSRASILTGKHQGECSLRDNLFDYPILETRTIGTLMREAGYTTYAIGKWGVGGAGESGTAATARPLDRGFDHHYGFLDHGAGHTYYHYDGLVNGAYMGVVEDREHRTDTALGIYSTDLFIARAKKVIADQVAENKKNGTDKPFFMYLAINTIHGSNGSYLDASVPTRVNLHVPGRPYPDATPGDGKPFGLGSGADWDWLQANREEIDKRNTWKYPYTESFTSKANKEERQRYATGITRLDDAMEDLKQTLIDLGIAENTLVIFTSDNGPTNEYGTNVDYFDSNGDFRGMKRDVLEGGVREPTFMWWPGHIPAGSVDDQPSMNHSWYSFLEQLVKSGAPGQLPEDVYTEYTHGQRGNQQVMVRIGDYVGVNTNIGAGKTFDDMTINVYDVAKDPSQSKDLKDDEYVVREILPRMRALMKSYHTLWRRPDSWANGGAAKNYDRPYDTTNN